MRYFFIVNFFCIGLFASSQRTYLLENDKVKIWKTSILPDRELPMHRHEHDRIVIPTKGGCLKKSEMTGEISDLELLAGKAYFLEKDPEGTMHNDINLTSEPIEVFVIELKY